MGEREGGEEQSFPATFVLPEESAPKGGGELRGEVPGERAFGICSARPRRFAMRLLAPLLLLGLRSVSGLTLCALSNSYTPLLSDSCSSTGGKEMAVDAARGEIEAGAMLLDNFGGVAMPLSEPTITWDAGAPPPGVSVSAALLGFVHTEKSPRYAGSAAGWFADSLLPWPSAPLPAGGSWAAWLRFDISVDAAPSVYTGVVSAGGASLPLRLEIFNVVVPPLASSPFRAVYAFDDSALSGWYGSSQIDVNASLRVWLDALAGLRMPATNIYASSPLPLWLYEYLGNQGAPILILADISSLPQTDDGGEALPPVAARRGAVAGPGQLRRGDCPVFDQAYIDRMVALLKPTWDALGPLGLQSRATVYGFDEIDASCEPAVRQLFAAAKAAFPGLRTLSAIDWPAVPLDLPLDVWVLQYQLVNRSVTDPWIAAGHELYVYHCIEPSEEGFMNSFIERALIEARLLFWFDFLLDVTGHLYYDVALWARWTAYPPFWESYTTASNVTFATAPGPISSISGGGDIRKLNFDPANFIWAPRTDIWANGDGAFIYPGPIDANRIAHPVSTIRFEAQRVSAVSGKRGA